MATVNSSLVIDVAVIQAAFEQHFLHYANKWDIPHHIKMWQLGTNAFERGDFEAFRTIYNNLKAHWQVFRGGIDCWSPQMAYDRLRQGDANFARRRLTELRRLEARDLWPVITNVREIKRNKHGPSVVAVSKFLHFWNPRLFVIVDDEIMWNRVLRQDWLWTHIKPIRDEVGQAVVGSAPSPASGPCDLISYLAILVWCSGFLKANPAIISEFVSYVHREKKDAELPADIEQYEAVAVEWFLEGLAALPPPGVHKYERRSP